VARDRRTAGIPGASGLGILCARQFGQDMDAGEDLARPMVLPLQVILGDRDVDHGHTNIAMAE
jgi:hypothetical protein